MECVHEQCNMVFIMMSILHKMYLVSCVYLGVSGQAKQTFRNKQKK